jgi:hypothetical protein
MPRVVHSWGGVATNTAKSGQKVMKVVDFSPIHHNKYFFRIKKVVAVDLWRVWTVCSFHILSVVIFHYSLFMLARLCMHPKGTCFAFPHPAMIGSNYLAGQVEARIYLKKDQEKVCNFLWHLVGGIFVAQGGLTRMTCGKLV